jgi:type II secretory pathway component PulF
VRYRTAAISCFVLILGMFGYSALIWAIFLPSLKQGLPNPLPAYEKMLLDIAVFCSEWRFILMLPIAGLGLIFAIAEVTSRERARRLRNKPRRA